MCVRWVKHVDGAHILSVYLLHLSVNLSFVLSVHLFYLQYLYGSPRRCETPKCVTLASKSSHWIGRSPTDFKLGKLDKCSIFTFLSFLISPTSSGNLGAKNWDNQTTDPSHKWPLAAWLMPRSLAQRLSNLTGQRKQLKKPRLAWCRRNIVSNIGNCQRIKHM